LAGGVNAPYSAEVADRIRSGNATGPAVRMHFKSPVSKNLSSENPIEKNVSFFLVEFFSLLFFFWGGGGVGFGN
jgi:hypothetical protein